MCVCAYACACVRVCVCACACVFLSVPLTGTQGSPLHVMRRCMMNEAARV